LFFVTQVTEWAREKRGGTLINFCGLTLPATANEIDLVELFSALWKLRALIVTVTVLAGFVGLAYAVMAPRYYSVQSVLRPTAIKDLD
tara:strand:- start:27853 stop:28116 length:264 start_codon:yes stop_codon:yes gene_type:complete